MQKQLRIVAVSFAFFLVCCSREHQRTVLKVEERRQPSPDSAIIVQYRDIGPLNYSCKGATMAKVLDDLFRKGAVIMYWNLPELDYPSHIDLEMKNTPVSRILSEAIKREKTKRIRLLEMIR